MCETWPTASVAYRLVDICTKCVLHVRVDFPHRSGVWNNGLHIGCAQPGSAKMLSFLRLCHAVWSRKDMWVYFYCHKSATRSQILPSLSSYFNYFFFTFFLNFGVLFLPCVQKICNDSTHCPRITVRRIRFISVLFMIYPTWRLCVFVYTRLCVGFPASVIVYGFWLKRGMAWLARFLLLLVVSSPASLL